MFTRQFRRTSYWLLLSFVFISSGQGHDSAPARQQLRLTATSAKTQYGASERITIGLTISAGKPDEHSTVSPFGTAYPKNGREEKETRHRRGHPDKVTVATVSKGIISVISATWNGKPIEPMLSFPRYSDDPVSIQARSLKAILPGERVAIPLTVPHLPGKGSLLITEQINATVQDTRNFALLYPLKKPGVYTFRFAYRYAGPADGHGNVFRGELLSNTVSFRLLGPKKEEAGDGLFCDPLDPEFSDTVCQPALEQIRENGTPADQGLIESFESDTEHDYVIMRSTQGSSTIPTNPAGALTNGEVIVDRFGRTVVGTGSGSGAIIQYDATPGLVYLDGTPRDPVSSLSHEFDHAFDMQAGKITYQATAPDNPLIARDEVEATQIQNDYLVKNGMPPVQKYCITLQSGVVTCANVPQPTPTPTPTPTPSPTPTPTPSPTPSP